MDRHTYEKTDDYKESIKILKDFINEILDGKIERLKSFDFGNLTKYIGDIEDPDMFLITQAIYIILWGDIFDLTYEKMGSWNWKNEHFYRGDTMNAYGSLLGKEDKKKNRSLAFRAKYFEAEKNPKLWKKIEEFYEEYHYIGNFILIPNRASIRNGINGARACYYNVDYCEGMRDYFDWFLVSIAEYQKKVEIGDIHLGKFEMQLQMNPEYNPNFMKIKDWEERFFLKHYFCDGEPILLFKTPLENRLKVTAPAEERGIDNYYQTEEYLELLEDYLDKSRMVIKYRSEEIVDFLKRKVAYC